MAGTLTISTLSDGTNSTSSTNCIQGSAKAWVNFSTSAGTPTTLGSYNVSSITYSTNVFTINFTNAMSNANFCSVASGRCNASYQGLVTIRTQSTSSVGVQLMTGSATATYLSSAYGETTYELVNVAVFR